MNTNNIKHLNLFYLFMDTDMEKHKKNTQARFWPKYPKKCVNCNKSEFTAKQWNRPKNC